MSQQGEKRKQQPNDDDEKAFYEFLAQQALLSQQEQQQEQEVAGETSLFLSPRYNSDEEIISRTYEEFCFDQPRLDSSLAGKGCRLLAEALSDYTNHGVQQPSFSLSERFVSGLLQALGRIEKSGADTSTTVNCSPTGLSILAWSVFGKIPNLICCRVKTIDEAGRLIGSYRGKELDHSRSSLFEEELPNEREETAATADRDESTEAGQLGAQSEALNGNGPVALEGDLGEVWAAESDPSDYCYDGEGGNGEGSSSSSDDNAFINLQQTWMAALPDANNPDGGQSNSEASWKDIAVAVASLLHECHYHKLSSLFNDPKKRKEIFSIVTQLSLTLLLVTEETTLTNSTISQEFIQTYPNSHWQQLALVPIHLLRDAAQHQTAVLPDYVQLLQTLLQVHQHVSGGSAKRIPTAVWLASSLLSDLCSQTLAQLEQKHPQQQLHQGRVNHLDTLTVIKRAVLEASDDLSLLLERTCISNSTTATDDGDQPLITALPWSCLSLFQTLSFSKMPSGDAQILLNSGLFRQWLLLWQQKHEDQQHLGSAVDCAAGPVVLRYVQQSVFDLCVSSPALLGKYAWRFPRFAATVVTTTAAAGAVADLSLSASTAKNSADALLWNLLGIQLSESVAPGGPSNAPKVTVQWKMKNHTPGTDFTKPANIQLAPPTVQQCQQGALDSYQCLLQHVVSVVSNWKQQQEMRPEEIQNNEMMSDDQEVLTCFVQVVQKLTTTQLLSGLFVSQLLQSPTIVKSSSLLNELQQLLVQWPASSKHNIAKTTMKDKIEEDSDTNIPETNQLGNNNINGHPPSLLLQQEKQKQSYAKIHASIDGLRRPVKDLQSLVESSTAASESPQHHFSSKAD